MTTSLKIIYLKAIMILTFNITPNFWCQYISPSIIEPFWPIAGALTFVLVIMFAIFIKVLMNYPKHEEIEITQKGIKCIEDKEYKEAIKYFDEAIKLNINYADAYFNKARALIKINESNKAIEMLKEFIEITNNIVNINVAKEIIIKLKNNNNEILNDIDYKYPSKYKDFITIFWIIVGFLLALTISTIFSYYIYSKS